MRYINVFDEKLKDDLLKQQFNLITSIKTNDKTIWIFEDPFNRFIFDINADIKDKFFFSDKLIMIFN